LIDPVPILPHASLYLLHIKSNLFSPLSVLHVHSPWTIYTSNPSDIRLPQEKWGETMLITYHDTYGFGAPEAFEM